MVKNIENKMNNLGRVYIAGKITGLSVEEFKANFESGVRDLETMGVIRDNIVNPARYTIDDGSWVEYMKLCLTKLIECDTIFMLDKYQTSKGARFELLTARKLDMRVIFQNNKEEI